MIIAIISLLVNRAYPLFIRVPILIACKLIPRDILLHNRFQILKFARAKVIFLGQRLLKALRENVEEVLGCRKGLKGQEAYKS
jgi:hypothetical protein